MYTKHKKTNLNDLLIYASSEHTFLSLYVNERGKNERIKSKFIESFRPTVAIDIRYKMEFLSLGSDRKLLDCVIPMIYANS